MPQSAFCGRQHTCSGISSCIPTRTAVPAASRRGGLHNPLERASTCMKTIIDCCNMHRMLQASWAQVDVLGGCTLATLVWRRLLQRMGVWGGGGSPLGRLWYVCNALCVYDFLCLYVFTLNSCHVCIVVCSIVCNHHTSVCQVEADSVRCGVCVAAGLWGAFCSSRRATRPRRGAADRGHVDAWLAVLHG